MSEITAVKNGGFPEPLGGHGIRLVDSRHESCGHATRVRLPLELGAVVVRRVVCEQCGQRYETTRVEDCGLEQELAELHAAVAPPAPAPAAIAFTPPSLPVEPEPVPAPPEPTVALSEPITPPAPEPFTTPEPALHETEPQPVATPEAEPEPTPNPFTSSAPITEAAPYEMPAPAAEPFSIPAPEPSSNPFTSSEPAVEPEPPVAEPIATPEAEPEPAPNPFTSSAPIPEAAPYEMPAPAAEPFSIPAPEQPVTAANPFSVPPTASPEQGVDSEPHAGSAPEPSYAPLADPAPESAPLVGSAPPPSAAPPSTTGLDLNTAAGAPAKPKRKTAVGPELRMPSFKRKPKAAAPVPTQDPVAAAPAAVAAPSKPKRKTAIGPEIKLPSFKRKPKAAAPAPTQPAPQAAPVPSAPTTPAATAAPAKPKRKTAIGPEIKLPSFKRKPKAAAPAPTRPAPQAAPVPSAPTTPAATAAPAKPKRKTAIGPEIKLPSFKRKPKAAPTEPVQLSPSAAPFNPSGTASVDLRQITGPPVTLAGPLDRGAPARTTRRTAIGPELTMPNFNMPNITLPSMPSFGGGGGFDFGGTSWRRLSVPIAGGAVIVGLLLLRGGGDDSGSDLGNLPTRAPGAAKTASQKPGSSKAGSDKATAKSAKSAKDAEVVAGSNFTLALPKGWERINPTGGATFAARSSDGLADATLWIKRDPTLDFATFQANSLAQLKELGGSSKVIDQQQGPTAEQTVVTLGTDAPKGAPEYEVVLRSSGSYFYYLATTLQPSAASDSVGGVKLLQDSLLPTGSSK